jgi:NAD(P)-dependent dehydrogenase (short-subunit alcohol dehydrogenase family)
VQVVVTGAGGRTGGLVAKKLIERKESYDFVGIVRSEEGAEKLREFGACEDSIVVGDILSDDGADVLASAFEGADRLVICTSAVPKIKPLSLIPVFLAKLFKKEGVRPKFTFKKDQMPEQIDWLGQKLQIDIAKKAGVEKCVLVGSMGGTDRSNFLNTIGDGNILVSVQKWSLKGFVD